MLNYQEDRYHGPKKSFNKYSICQGDQIQDIFLCNHNAYVGPNRGKRVCDYYEDILFKISTRKCKDIFSEK